MEPVVFEDFLRNISINSLRVIDEAIDRKKYVAIDLSSTNKVLFGFDVSSSKAWEEYLHTYLKEQHATVAYGGYLEQRDIYSRSAYFKKESSENERNIHLGIDLWCDANTKVLSVLNGEIHSFQNNTNFGDYGPTIIIKHCFENIEFYSLYGHLSLASIKEVEVGQKVQQGEVIGYLGDSAVNGDYAPHLHFQLIRDMQEQFGDYPGVTSTKDFEFYKNNCPDPNLLLKF